MRANEISQNIGESVYLSCTGDLGIDPVARELDGVNGTLVKQCKSGLLQVNFSGTLHSFPARNIHSIKNKEVN